MLKIKAALSALAGCALVLAPTVVYAIDPPRKKVWPHALMRDGKPHACVVYYDFAWDGGSEDRLNVLTGTLIWTIHSKNGPAFLLESRHHSLNVSTKETTPIKIHKAFMVGRGQVRAPTVVFEECDEKKAFCGWYFGSAMFDILTDLMFRLELRIDRGDEGDFDDVPIELSFQEREKLIGCVKDLTDQAVKERKKAR